MKIALFEMQDWEKEYLVSKLPEGHELMFFHDPIHKIDPQMYRESDLMAIFVYSHITRNIIQSMPNLKCIATMSTGYDHIDLTACKERNIVVANVPRYGESTVAEHTFALLLSISRRLQESYARVKDGYFSPEGLMGFDLNGRTIGVVGVGNIGQHVVRIAKGFGMRVLAYKKTPDPELEKELGCTFADLDTIYRESDIVTLHIPYSEETHHFLNTDSFGKMKQGVIVLNTARGGLVDTKALLDALDSGKVQAAGLDVLEEEPILREEKELLSKEFEQEKLLSVVKNHLLLYNKKVAITPHNAFNSKEALERILNVTVENIAAFISGTPENTVGL